MILHYKSIPVRYTSQVYEPSEDSFLLAEAALIEVREGDSVLEIGCGCGIVSAIVAAKRQEVTVVATDINPYAVICARSNGTEAILADMFDGIKGRFDLILFNPPYLPTDPEERTDDWINFALDGGMDGRRLIDRFLMNVRDHLTEHGRFLLLVSSLNDIDTLMSAVVSLGFEVREIIRENVWFEQLTVIAGAPA